MLFPLKRGLGEFEKLAQSTNQIQLLEKQDNIGFKIYHFGLKNYRLCANNYN